MDPLTAIAASGMRARMEALDLLANNLANAATSGYKADREFHDVYAVEGGGKRTVMPDAGKPWTDFSQGAMTATGNPLNLALHGKGFFAVNGPAGPLYTRNGAFTHGTDGVVRTAEGYALRLDNGQPLRIDPRQPFEITADGTAMQGGQVLGRIQISDVANPNALVKQPAGYFQLDSSGAVAAAAAEVHQGKLEAANVSSADTAVRLVNVMRQFEMLQRAIALGGEMNRRAVEDVARVGG
jgi:flagellar basal body rod protein FlgG